MMVQRTHKTEGDAGEGGSHQRRGRWKKTGSGKETLGKERRNQVAEMGKKSEGGREENSGQGEVSLRVGTQPGPPGSHPPPSPGAARDTYKATKQFFHSRPELLPFS